MKKMNFTALGAVANVFALPIRALFAPAKPALTLTAPVMPHTPRAMTGLIRAEVTGDPKAMIAALQGAHNEFKATMEGNLGAKADSAEVQAKLDAINGTMNTLEASLNEHALKLAGQQMGGGAVAPVDPEYTGAFASFMRSGSREDEQKLAAAQKAGVRAAMSEGVPADGGLLTTNEWDRTITGRLKLISPIRSEATVISISKAVRPRCSSSILPMTRRPDTVSSSAMMPMRQRPSSWAGSAGSSSCRSTTRRSSAKPSRGSTSRRSRRPGRCPRPPPSGRKRSPN